jgi:ubiquinone/menaquinone biosynthesis C-methylase UbiE
MRAANQKAYKGSGMEGQTARWYARTRGNDVEEFRRQAHDIAKRLPRGCELLEVAPGPGYFAIELATLGDFKITGLDISQTFVQIASEHSRNAGVRIDFRQGSASAMPFSDEAFDFIYCAAAFKNFTEPVKALDEMHRVLRPGAAAVVMDLRKDVSLDQIDSYVDRSGRSWFDGWTTKQIFRRVLVKRAYTKEQFAHMAQESRFGGCEIREQDISLEIELRKRGARV